MLMAVLITLFVAGVLAPSLLRSDSANSAALAAGSLHRISLAGLRFTFTNQNLGYAFLGTLAGSISAYVLNPHSAKPKATTSVGASVLRSAPL
jgi:hypothetical protein